MDVPYIQIPREFFNSDFWKASRTYSFQEAMLDLASMVAYQDRNYIAGNKVIALKKYECVASLRFLAKRFGWSKDKIARFLNTLKQTHNLTQRIVQGESVLSFDISSAYNNDTQNYETQTSTQTQPQTSTQTRTKSRQRRDKQEEGKESKEDIYKENNIKEILEARLLRVVRCIFPKAVLPRPDKEVKAWAKIASSVSDEQIDLVAKFYALDKSDSYDETWNRKQGVTTLMNNWQATCELATAYFDNVSTENESRDRKAEAYGSEKNNKPPTFYNQEEDSDAATWMLNHQR